MVIWTGVVALVTEIYGLKGYLRCRINMTRRLIDVKREAKDGS